MRQLKSENIQFSLKWQRSSQFTNLMMKPIQIITDQFLYYSALTEFFKN